MVDGNAIEPGAELCLASKAREGLDGFEQDLLGGVFSIGAAMEHAEREVEDPGEVPGQQHFELIAFASVGAGNEIYICIVGEVIEERVWKGRLFGLHGKPPTDKTTGSWACDSC